MERGVERLETAAKNLARLSWVTFAAAAMALVAAVILISEHFFTELRAPFFLKFFLVPTEHSLRDL